MANINVSSDWGTGSSVQSLNVDSGSNNPGSLAISKDRVGIGTTLPAEKLEVDGNIKLTDYNNDRIWATKKVYNVLDYGAVTGGGSGGTNKTAFQNALTDAGNAGGGIVYVPDGLYDIDETSGGAHDGHLSIPAEVTLEGNWVAPQTCGNLSSLKGSVLRVYETSAESSEPFIKLNGENASVKGLTICYPNQAVGGTYANPSYTAYPWCISGSSDNANVIDVTLINPYNGINLTGSRHLIRGLYGQPLNTGIEIDTCADVGRIEDVHFWPFWSNLKYADWFDVNSDVEKVRSYQLNNAKGLVLKTTDWEIVNNYFCFGYHRGIELTGTGSPNTPNGQFSNINCDQVDYGIYVDYSKQGGIFVSNLNLACSTTQVSGNYDAQHRIGIFENNHNTNMLSVDGAAFWGPFVKCIWWQNGEYLLVSKAAFLKWDTPAIDQVAMDIDGGYVVVQVCYFTRYWYGSYGANSEAINIASGARVQLLGNEVQADVNKITGAQPNQIAWPSGNESLGAAKAALAIFSTSNVTDGLAELKFGGVNGKVNASIGYRHQNGNDNTQGDIVLATRNVTTDTNLTERVRVLAGGSMGIGTASPVAKQEISGQADDIETNYRTSSTYSQVLISDSDLPGYGLKLGYRYQSGVTEYGRIQTCNNVGTTSLGINPNGGNVGIGLTNPAQKLDVSGTIHASNLNGGATTLSSDASGNIIRTPSDKRLKKNIRTIKNAISKVLKLRGVFFDWKKQANMGSSGCGLIAQEVERVIPELVSKSEGGLLSVNYPNMVAVLIEAIKEQQNQILSLKTQFDKLSKKK